MQSKRSPTSFKVAGDWYELPLTDEERALFTLKYEEALKERGARTINTLRKLAQRDDKLGASLASVMVTPDEKMVRRPFSKGNKRGPLTRVRLSANLTVREMADKLGIHDSTVRFYEKQEQWPKEAEMPDWAKAILDQENI